MENADKLQRRKARESRELARRKAELAKPKSHYYLWYLLLLLCLVYIVDEVTSNIHANLLPEIAADIHNGDTGIFYTMESVATFMLVVSIFYKPLADRFGRKPFIVINTLGMALALFTCFWARENSIWLYFIGFFLLRFFVTPDQQVVYIYETTKKENRAKAYSIIKGIAELGLVLIPLLRVGIMGGDLFGIDLSGADYTKWRFVFLIPAIIGAVIAFVCLIFARETDAFLKQRIAYLEKTDEQRAADKEAKRISASQGGIIAGFKAIFKSRQLLFLIIITFVYILGRFLTSSYSDILARAFSLQGLDKAQITAQITRSTFFFPFSCAAITFIYGFFSDKFGRKIVCVGLLLLSAVSYGLFAFGAMNDWSTVVLGLLIGLFLGSFWGVGDTIIMMVGESSPTNVRASVMSIQGGFYGIGMIASIQIGSAILRLSGENNENLTTVLWAFLGFALIAYVAAAIMLMVLTRETKGTEVETVEIESAGKK